MKIMFPLLIVVNIPLLNGTYWQSAPWTQWLLPWQIPASFSYINTPKEGTGKISKIIKIKNHIRVSVGYQVELVRRSVLPSSNMLFFDTRNNPLKDLWLSHYIDGEKKSRRVKSRLRKCRLKDKRQKKKKKKSKKAGTWTFWVYILGFLP